MDTIIELSPWKSTKKLYWIDVPIVDPERAVVHSFWIEDIRNLGFDPIWYSHKNGIMLGFQTQQVALEFLRHDPEAMWQHAKKRCDQMRWLSNVHEADDIVRHLRALLKCPASEVFNRLFEVVGDVERLREQKEQLTEALYEMHKEQNCSLENMHA